MAVSDQDLNLQCSLLGALCLLLSSLVVVFFPRCGVVACPTVDRTLVDILGN